MDDSVLAWLLALGVSSFGLVIVLFQACCCGPSEDIEGEDQGGAIMGQQSASPTKIRESLKSGRQSFAASIDIGDIDEEIQRTKDTYSGSFVVLLAIVYSTALFHLNDLATDIATVVEYSGVHDGLWYVIFSIASMLIYRIISAWFFWKSKYGFEMALFQFFDLELYRQVYHCHTGNRYTKNLVYIKRFESVFESFPQAIIALHFILVHEPAWTVYMSLANSIVSIAGSISWHDDTAFEYHEYYSAFWFKRYFLRVFEVTARLFTLGYVSVVLDQFAGVIIILVVEIIAYYALRKTVGKELFKSADNVLMYLIAVPNFSKDGYYLLLYYIRAAECVLLAVLSGGIEAAEHEAGVSPEDKAWLLTIAGGALIGELILLYLVHGKVASEGVGDDIFTAAKDGDIDRILDAIKFGGKTVIMKKDKHAGNKLVLHHAATSGQFLILNEICKCMVSDIDPSDKVEINKIIDTTDDEGFTALYYAIISGHEECVRVLIAYKANCITHSDQSDENKSLPKEERGKRYIHEAAENGYGRTCETLLNIQQDINRQVDNSTKWTPILYACSKVADQDNREELIFEIMEVKHAKIEDDEKFVDIKIILDNDSNVFNKVGVLNTSRMEDLDYQKRDSTKPFYSKIFNIPTSWTDDEGEVHQTLENNKSDTLVRFIPFGLDEEQNSQMINVKDLSKEQQLFVGNVTLVYKIRRRYYHCIQTLIDHGADVNYAGADRRQPLALAIRSGDPYLVKIMADAGAKCTLQDISRANLTAKQLANLQYVCHDHGIDIPPSTVAADPEFRAPAAQSNDVKIDIVPEHKPAAQPVPSAAVPAAYNPPPPAAQQASYNQPPAPAQVYQPPAQNTYAQAPGPYAHQPQAQQSYHQPAQAYQQPPVQNTYAPQSGPYAHQPGPYAHQQAHPPAAAQQNYQQPSYGQPGPYGNAPQSGPYTQQSGPYPQYGQQQTYNT